MEITLSATKVESIKRICTDMISKTEVSIQELSSLIGTLNATVEAVIPASLYVRELQMFQTKCLLKSKRNYQQMIILPQTSRGEINWWLQQLEHWNGKQIRLSSNPDLVIETDASKTGWGAVCLTQNLRMGGPWNPSEKKLHINVLELKAVQFAIQSLTKHKQNIHVHIKSDNTTVVAYLNKMGGTRSELLLQTTKQIWTHCLSKKIMITSTAEHLPGIQNVQADLESRQMRDTSNWMLNKGIFKQINQMWGPLKIDLFADRLNTQLENYMSWRPDPYAMGMDAFQIPWNNKRGYAFPPFCLITRCLSKVLKEKSEIVIITPAWQTQPYYPLLLTLSIDNPILLPPMKNLLLSPEGVVHPLVSNQTLKLVAWKVSGDKYKQQEFRSKLPSSWLQDGGQGTRRAYNKWGEWDS